MNNNYSLIIPCAVLLLGIAGCSDYKSGFEDGYDGVEKQGWIVFGKADYLQGFSDGEADKFQQDWVSVNTLEGDTRTCRAPVITTEAGMFTPVGYQRVAQDNQVGVVHDVGRQGALPVGDAPEEV